MIVKTYNQSGEEVGQTKLPSEIFDVKLNSDLVHQVAVSQTANRRKVIAHTKDRSEVSGGGKKPWRQKGTGRARHGSIRSPLWYHGGVTFGPTKERVFKKEIPQKMKKAALFMVLSEKAKTNLLILLEDLKLEAIKTKIMVKLLENLPSKKENSLIALPSMDKNLIFSIRNIDSTRVMQAKDLNVLDLLSFKYLIMPKESIKVIKETFLGGEKSGKKGENLKKEK